MYTIRTLAREIELTEEEFIPLLEAFIEQTEEDLEKIRENAALKEKDLVSERIHSIRGAALNLGFVEISRITEALSSLNKRGKFEGMAELLDSCFKEVDTLKRLLLRNAGEKDSGC